MVTLHGCERFRCTTWEESWIKRGLKKITPKESVDLYRSGLWSQPHPYHSQFLVAKFPQDWIWEAATCQSGACAVLHITSPTFCSLNCGTKILNCVWPTKDWFGKEKERNQRGNVLSWWLVYTVKILPPSLSLTIRNSLPSPGPASPFQRTNETARAPCTQVAQGLLHNSKTCLYGKLLIQICHNRPGRSRTIRNMSAHLAYIQYYDHWMWQLQSLGKSETQSIILSFLKNTTCPFFCSSLNWLIWYVFSRILENGLTW